jgi:hypothetical protein
VKKLSSLPGMAVLAIFLGLALAVPATAAVAQAGNVVGGVNLGTPANNPHRWGNCNVQDFKQAPGYGWVIVSWGYWDPSGYHGTSPQIVRNGMLFGWFDRGGAPGFGCPANWQHNPGVHDQRVVAQDFQGGRTLLWVPGMDHAQPVDHGRWPAIKWGLQYLGQKAFVGQCLAFVVQAYNNGLYGGRIVLHGGPYDTATTTARAYQWWYGGHPGDANVPFGMFAVWNRAEAKDGSGHIALGLGGGYMLTTEYAGDNTVHVQKVVKDINYFGWEVPK